MLRVGERVDAELATSRSSASERVAYFSTRSSTPMIRARSPASGATMQ
jgi:hypothetical protein